MLVYPFLRSGRFLAVAIVVIDTYGLEFWFLCAFTVATGSFRGPFYPEVVARSA